MWVISMKIHLPWYSGNDRIEQTMFKFPLFCEYIPFEFYIQSYLFEIIWNHLSSINYSKHSLGKCFHDMGMLPGGKTFNDIYCISWISCIRLPFPFLSLSWETLQKYCKIVMVSLKMRSWSWSKAICLCLCTFTRN